MQIHIKFSRSILWLIVLFGCSLYFSPGVYAANIVVNAPDDLMANDGKCTLREAITNASNNSASAPAAGECAAGSGSEVDTITFSDNQTINLVATLPIIQSDLIIDGGPHAITINGGYLPSSSNEFQSFLVFGGTVTFSHLTIAYSGIYTNPRIVTPFGGAIHIRGGVVNINTSTFSHNFARSGGAIFVNGAGSVTVSNSTFSDNRTLTSDGAAIANAGIATVLNSTFTNNVAKSKGGAIANSGDLTVMNSTFGGNSAYGFGSALYAANSVTTSQPRTNIAFSTFHGNKVLPPYDVPVGGNGMPFVVTGGTLAFQGSGAISLNNSIVTASTGQDCANTAMTGSNNLIDDVTCGSDTAFRLGMVTGLGPLLNDGSPLQTFTLQPGSNALDRVSCSTPATDQRGIARPQGTACDIGAYELSNAALLVVTLSGQPANLSNNPNATFNFSSAAGVTFACRLDAGTFSPCTSPQSYSALLDGNHSFAVQATDSAGNTGTAGHTWVIDTTPPDTMITMQPPASSGSNVSFIFTRTEGDGIYACQLDGAPFSVCTPPQSYNNLSPGVHTFVVQATDGVGNTDPTPASYTWNVVSLQVTITRQPANPTKSKDAKFKFTSSMPNSTFACSLDGSNFKRCSSPKSYTKVGNGSHTFTVQATDPVGNISTATYTWVVNTKLKTGESSETEDAIGDDLGDVAGDEAEDVSEVESIEADPETQLPHQLYLPIVNQ